jgi:hypothetical protein
MFDDAADLFLFIEGDDFPETNSLILGERKRARWRLCFSSCDGFFGKVIGGRRRRWWVIVRCWPTTFGVELSVFVTQILKSMDALKTSKGWYF